MTTRTTPRTALLPVLALALSVGLGACSDDGGDTASDPDATSSSPSPTDDTTPSETPSQTPQPDPGTAETINAVGSAGVSQATMVHATDVGGSASTLAFALDTDQAVQDFVAGFQNGLAEKVTATVAEVAGKAPDAHAHDALTQRRGTAQASGAANTTTYVTGAKHWTVLFGSLGTTSKPASPASIATPRGASQPVATTAP